VSLALGAEATFVGRSIDTERAHLAELVERAARHQGASFIEVYQNCNIFNDGAFAPLKDERDANQIRLVHGEPILFDSGKRGVVLEDSAHLRIAEVAEVGMDRILVHDAHRADPTLAYGLSHLAHNPAGPTPVGLFRQVQRPVYGDLVQAQLEQAVARRGQGDLESLLAGADSWDVG
jgi:2-oxoglutarate/2-oxoacid ferredoxin oxidoreductase subunit beta